MTTFNDESHINCTSLSSGNRAVHLVCKLFLKIQIILRETDKQRWFFLSAACHAGSTRTSCRTLLPACNTSTTTQCMSARIRTNVRPARFAQFCPNSTTLAAIKQCAQTPLIGRPLLLLFVVVFVSSELLNGCLVYTKELSRCQNDWNGWVGTNSDSSILILLLSWCMIYKNVCAKKEWYQQIIDMTGKRWFNLVVSCCWLRVFLYKTNRVGSSN